MLFVLYPFHRRTAPAMHFFSYILTCCGVTYIG
jgi:hypothetical protein